jgi:hypothetical protein
MTSQTYKLAINKPCHENWDAMSITNTGRHCEQCSKDVIDFTNYSKEAIINFFVANKGKSICGRMHKKQIDNIVIDGALLYSNIAFWKKFLIIFLIIFGYELYGSSFTFAQVIESDSAKQEKIEIIDTAKVDSINVDGFFNLDSTTIVLKDDKVTKDTLKKEEKYKWDFGSKKHDSSLSHILNDSFFYSIEGIDISGLISLEPINQEIYFKNLIWNTGNNDALDISPKSSKKEKIETVVKSNELISSAETESKTPQEQEEQEILLAAILPKRILFGSNKNKLDA